MPGKRDWKIGAAFGVQTAFGTKNATVAALSGSLTSTNGIVLGHRAAGDAESGITVPNFVRIFEEKPDVAASFTKSARDSLRIEAQGFSIAIPIKGNGATATPSAGEAAPLTGIDALLQMAGLIGANGTAPVYNYTPRHAGSSGGSTIYGTAKLWIDDASFVVSDLLVESLEMEFTPGGVCVATFNFGSGVFTPSADFATGVTFPTFTYGTQSTLSAPSLVSANHIWGQDRGFESLTLTIENETEEFQDSNSVTGKGLSQTARSISIAASIFADTDDTDYDEASLHTSTAPTDDLSFTLGTAAGAGNTINALGVTVNNIQPGNIKRNRVGQYVVIEHSDAIATATSAGGELTLGFK